MLAKVEIYTKDWCPYCVRAKRLLADSGVDVVEYAIERGGEKRGEMIDRSGGRTTVPQIFIGGRHIGGCDDLMDLHASGKLAGLLAAPRQGAGQA